MNITIEYKSASELSVLQDQLQQTSLYLVDKCHRQAKLEDQLEEHRLKIHRADQLVCVCVLVAERSMSLVHPLVHIYLDQALSADQPSTSRRTRRAGRRHPCPTAEQREDRTADHLLVSIDWR